jgi:vacuolar protein sorting-associated protein 45
MICFDLCTCEGFANNDVDLQGVENVYTQHTPHICQTLDLLLKGRLRETSYPFVEGDEHARTQRPQDIIVFMLGGTTYEESRAVALLNQQLAGQARILLAGTSVHNSNSFLEMMSESALHHSPSVYGAPPGVANAASLTTGLAAAQQENPTGQNSAPTPNNNSGINLRAGGYELNVGGAAGSGLYRASGTNANDVGASFQIDGIRDGARNFFGSLRERVGETVQRVGSPRGE